MSTPAPPALGELRALRQAFEPRLARHAPAARLVRAGVLGDRPMLTAALFIAANMAVFFVTGWVKCGTCCRPLRIVQALAAAAIFARIAKFACGVAKICPIDMASKHFDIPTDADVPVAMMAGELAWVVNEVRSRAQRVADLHASRCVFSKGVLLALYVAMYVVGGYVSGAVLALLAVNAALAAPPLVRLGHADRAKAALAPHVESVRAGVQPVADKIAPLWNRFFGCPRDSGACNGNDDAKKNKEVAAAAAAAQAAAVAEAEAKAEAKAKAEAQAQAEAKAQVEAAAEAEAAAKVAAAEAEAASEKADIAKAAAAAREDSPRTPTADGFEFVSHNVAEEAAEEHAANEDGDKSGEADNLIGKADKEEEEQEEETAE
eukprot:TRINITY_DN1015_c7_g1_i1.p2 TRINITY_DN1015_c7_g1~~TRINITY_DN1015_c7_g1_i1.p2  ORF type:complete len:377 (+),score=178.07 TRINITY_DN1015_c7_g1_i1:100-1230(+)